MGGLERKSFLLSKMLYLLKSEGLKIENLNIFIRNNFLGIVFEFELSRDRKLDNSG